VAAASTEIDMKIFQRVHSHLDKATSTGTTTCIMNYSILDSFSYLWRPSAKLC